ncbi:T9SS type A sorting domain-containing protein [Mesoflavibacter profundi]|uniref:T9SS type A sorting domain-containing protein n=1 Tax=Mesoflavibacter profundi TaxID=2708110 RepID=UPI00168BCECE|nr:T9SS type A sorting domain-containing protein [Mesoflavibacter profundi]
MKNKLLFTLVLLVSLNFIYAQSGDTINDAIEVDGTLTNVDVLDYNSASNSGLVPACISAEDVFYKHTVNVGNNKMTIGMASAGLALVTDVEYQIFLAPEGDIGQLQELDCDAYTVFVLVGGSFQFVIDDIGTANTYYLRVYKNSDSGINLSSLLGSTSITMDSEFDPTLSTANFETTKTKIINKDQELEIVGNTTFENSTIYTIDGRQVQTKSNTVIDKVDISNLSRGLYVLVLENDTSIHKHKFIKK